MIGVLQNGTLVAWGKTPGSVIPSTLKGKTFTDVAATMDSFFALESDGTLHCAGGGGDPSAPVCPIPVSARTGIIAVGSGAATVYAVKSDGTVAAWGRNDWRQLRIPTTATNIIDVEGGARHAVALRADGTVVSWGDNTVGQATTPPGLRDIVQVSAGEDHSCALSSTGTVVCWGSNANEQIRIPGTVRDIVKIASGRYVNLAIKSDGTLIRWGSFATVNEFANFTGGPITNAIAVASDNQNSLVGLGDIPVRMGGRNLNGIYTSRTPTRTPTP